MIEDWLNIEEAEHGERKRLFVLGERGGGRVAVQADLMERVRAHYDDPRHIADDIAELGFPGAAAILRERLPTDARTRSGEVGEILATEFVEHQTGFRIPVRRLRYKDGREMALRGDDFLGIEEVDGRLAYLKGEAKSGQAMAAGVINAARARLNDDDGRPTPISLLFVADRLLEGSEEDEALGRQIRNAVGRGTIRARDVTHGLFTLTGNDRRADLEADLAGAGGDHGHISVNLRINDSIIQSKTKKPVRFEITEGTRKSITAWLDDPLMIGSEYLWPGRFHERLHISTRQYARLVRDWVTSIGLEPTSYGTHTMRRTKVAQIYRKTGNLRAVQLLLGHTKMDSTVRYLGVELEDALAIAEAVEI